MVDKISIIIGRMRGNPVGVRFVDLCMVCDRYFGPPRQSGSHRMRYKTPWPESPNINIQNSRGKAKAYQVKQVLSAIDRLEKLDEPKG